MKIWKKRIVFTVIFAMVIFAASLNYRMVYASEASDEAVGETNKSTLGHGVIDKDTTISGDVSYTGDLYIKQGCTVTLSGTIVITGDVYIFGTLNNRGTLTVDGTLNTLHYGSFMSAGSYSYGYFNNYSKATINNLNVTDSFLNMTVPSITHSYNSGTITTEPTCSSAGVMSYECTVCGDVKTETVAELGHSYDNGKVTTEATCTTSGVKTYTCARCGAKKTEKIAELGHSYDNGKVTTEATCTTSGVKTYTCVKCGDKKTEALGKISHNYKETIVKATTSNDGYIEKKCAVGGETLSKTVIYRPEDVNLARTSFVYSGKVQKPDVSVIGSDRKEISSSNYTVSYSGETRNVGTYTVKISFIGNYSGTISKTFTIIPKGTSISKISAVSRGFSVKWKKQAKQTSGYQLQYSASRKFAGAKTVTINKNKTVSRKITKLARKKKYYVRIRTYKKVNGSLYYSKWSTVKTVSTKK